MSTSELVAEIAEAHGVSKMQAQAIVDSMLKTILGAAANGEDISLPGFGKFKVKETPEREGAIRPATRKSRSPLRANSAIRRQRR